MKKVTGPTGRISFFAMTQKGYSVLQEMIDCYPGAIDTVVSAQDSSIREDFYDAIRDLCRIHHICFHDRREKFEIRSEYIVTVSWRWLVAAQNSKVIVFHDSLLPRYRGFNPLVSALINGENRIGVTALFAAEEYDRGEIIAQTATDILYPITIQEAIELVIANYRQLTREIAGSIVRGDPLPRSIQNDEAATYSLWRDKEDYRIDWNRSSDYIKRFVDAVGHPYLGAVTMIDGRRARLLDAEVVADVNIENRTPGKVIFIHNMKPIIVCGQGLIKVNELVDDATGVSLLPLPRFRVRFA